MENLLVFQIRQTLCKYEFTIDHNISIFKMIDFIFTLVSPRPCLAKSAYQDAKSKEQNFHFRKKMMLFNAVENRI